MYYISANLKVKSKLQTRPATEPAKAESTPFGMITNDWIWSIYSNEASELPQIFRTRRDTLYPYQPEALT